MTRRVAIGLVAAGMTLSVAGLLFAVSTEVQEGLVVGAGNNSISMTDIYGENARSFEVAPNARIILDGTPAKLNELKMGDHVVLTLRQQDRRNKVVLRITAHSAGTSQK